MTSKARDLAGLASDTDGLATDAEVSAQIAALTINPSEYATAAQGTLADSAVQPDDNVTLGTVTADGLTVNTGSTFSVTGEFGGATNKIAMLNDDGGGRNQIDSTSTGSVAKKLDIATGGTKRLRIEDNGDVQFFEDTGTTAKMVWSSSSESLTVEGAVTANNYIDTVYTLTGTALDPANGNTQSKTMSANTTFTDSLATGESIVLMLSGGDTYTVTYPTMTWIGGEAPTLTATDALVFWKVGSTLYGAYIGSVA